MTRTCDVCGAGISDTAGICPGCGLKHEASGEESNVVYDKPRWGSVKVDLKNLRVRVDEQSLQNLVDVLCRLEKAGSLTLISKKLDRKLDDSIDLRGPLSVFLYLLGNVAALNRNLDLVTFENIPATQMEDVPFALRKMGP